eukprot:CAMPEP_0195115518 /NCGR_PEP_ID=MMETSP0448-20130528/109217_1 /TAXON_ID=66468 /ORGANISM="Heterocapsa triquestra, Strain CCMP 448" /LENGTH=223 /DNA_ID=CAMNT_0040152627 /DNA_START=52 /DNA_END=720 /DNA_ORIENTATION=+
MSRRSPCSGSTTRPEPPGAPPAATAAEVWVADPWRPPGCRGRGELPWRDRRRAGVVAIGHQRLVAVSLVLVDPRERIKDVRDWTADVRNLLSHITLAAGPLIDVDNSASGLAELPDVHAPEADDQRGQPPLHDDLHAEVLLASGSPLDLREHELQDRAEILALLSADSQLTQLGAPGAIGERKEGPGGPLDLGGPVADRLEGLFGKQHSEVAALGELHRAGRR